MEDDQLDDRLDPDQDEHVRRLLADARHDEPVPADLADRLDRVLAGLATEGPDERPRVVDLATQRRRRRARNLLVAAAAVVAVGVGLGQLDLGSMSASDQDESTSSSADAGGADAASEAQAAAPSSAPTDLTDQDASSVDRRSVEVAKKPVEIGDQDFDSVAKREVLLSRAAAGATADFYSYSLSAGDATKASWFSCKRAPFGQGRLVAVSYRGTSAVLAVRPPTGDSVVVELLQCGTATVLRSATIPMP